MNYAISILKQKQEELAKMRDNLSSTNERIKCALSNPSYGGKEDREILEGYVESYEKTKSELADKIDSLTHAMECILKMDGGEDT